MRIGVDTDPGNGWDENRTIYFINPRDYQIEYSCPTGYDALYLANLSWDDNDIDNNSLVDAFKAAKTEVPTPIINSTGLDAEVINAVIAPYIQRDDLWIYAKTHASSDYAQGDENSSYRRKTALLFAVKNAVIKNFNGDVIHSDALGLTTTYDSDQYNHEILPYYSMIFVDRINALPLNPVDKMNEFRRVIIHELGHQRGVPGSVAHTEGHKGSDYQPCVMRDLE